MSDQSKGAHFEVVVLGGGYAGLMAALRLGGRGGLSRVALVDRRGVFVERIRLQEALARPLVPRLPPYQRLLAGTNAAFIQGRVLALDPERRRVEIDGGQGTLQLGFDTCVYALGSSTDLTAAGAAAHAYRLDPGDGPRAAAALRHRLETKAPGRRRIVVVGGANTAVEAAAEIKSRWPLDEVTLASNGRVGDFGKGDRLGDIVRRELTRLGIELLDDQAVAEVTADEVVTETGLRMAADICVWAAGQRASPVARRAGLAVDPSDRIRVDARLRSTSHACVVAVGDAAVPLGPTGASYRPSAFAAVISAAYAADSILRERHARSERPFSFSAYGQGVALGRRGLGFFTFPDDGRAYAILTGPTALMVRNLFVSALVFFLKLERRLPGLFLFWIGRRRVRWEQVGRAPRAAPRLETAAAPQAARPDQAGY